MFPNNKQRGSLLPIAAFILVGLGILATSLTRIASQNTYSSTQEALSISAFYSAESGAQWAMGVLFYPEVSKEITDDRCLNQVNDYQLNFNAPGLKACHAIINCNINDGVDKSISYYKIKSSGQCEVGHLSASRKIEVSAKLSGGT